MMQHQLFSEIDSIIYPDNIHKIQNGPHCDKLTSISDGYNRDSPCILNFLVSDIWRLDTFQHQQPHTKYIKKLIADIVSDLYL